MSDVTPVRERCSFCHRPYDDVGPKCQCVPVVPEQVVDTSPVLRHESEYHRCVKCGSTDRGQRDWGLDHAQACGGFVPRPPDWGTFPKPNA